MAEQPTRRPDRPDGKIVLRIIGQRPRCEFCPKIPPDRPKVPEEAVELSERNWRAYRHYRECVSMGTFDPWSLDPIVRRNAMRIREIEEKAAYLDRLRIAKIAKG